MAGIRGDRNDHHRHPGTARPAAVGSVALDGRHRAGDRVDPRRPRGDHRRLDVRRPEAGQHRTGTEQLRHRPRRAPSTSRAPASVRCSSGSSPTGSAARSCSCSRSASTLSPPCSRRSRSTPTWYFAARFLTGAGIGGEYAAINSAIDELIPAKYRGRVDVAINGSFWVGAAVGSLLTIPLLDPTIVDRPGAGASRSASAPCWRSASCSSGATSRRARAGCSSTAVRTRARRSSATSSRPSRTRPAASCPR